MNMDTVKQIRMNFKELLDKPAKSFFDVVDTMQHSNKFLFKEFEKMDFNDIEKDKMKKQFTGYTNSFVTDLKKMVTS